MVRFRFGNKLHPYLRDFIRHRNGNHALVRNTSTDADAPSDSYRFRASQTLAPCHFDVNRPRGFNDFCLSRLFANRFGLCDRDCITLVLAVDNRPPSRDERTCRHLLSCLASTL